MLFFIKEIINHIRASSHSSAYASTLSPPIIQQVISSMNIIMGEDGTSEGGYLIFASYLSLILRNVLFHISFESSSSITTVLVLKLCAIFSFRNHPKLFLSCTVKDNSVKS